MLESDAYALSLAAVIVSAVAASLPSGLQRTFRDLRRTNIELAPFVKLAPLVDSSARLLHTLQVSRKTRLLA